MEWMTAYGKIQAELQEERRKLSAELLRPNHAWSTAAGYIRMAVLLGEFEWTLPMGMTAKQACSLAATKDPKLVRDCFVEFYTQNDSERYRLLRGRLVSSSRLQPCCELLVQCCSAYEREDFLIAVPSLILVLEGSLAAPEKAEFVKESHRREFFAGKVTSLPPDSMYRFIWRSIETFVGRLYQSDSFGDTRPGYLNRHRVLHGRDVCDWDRAECLQLLQGLETVISVTQ
jgi:hypothetical protein